MEDTYIDMKQTKVLERSSFALDLGPLQTLTVDGGYADYQHSEREPDGTAASTFKNKEWDSRAEALFGALGPLSGLALGVQVQNRDFSGLGEAADYLLPTTTDSAAGFMFAEAPVGSAVNLQFGARVEQVSVKGTPSSGLLTKRNFSPVSGSAGILFEASETVKLGLTLSSAARAPAQTELFAIGPHDGPATYETGDPTLGIERANSLETTLRLRYEKVQINFSLWGANFDNYIYGRLTGQTCDEEGVCAPGDDEELKDLFYEQHDAKFRGVEGEAIVQMYAGSAGTLNAQILGDYVRAKLNGAGNVPRIPPYHLAAGPSWERQRLNAGVMLRYTAKQDKTAIAETPTKSFTSLDMHVGWRPFAADPGLELELVGRNIGDTEQRNAVALNKDEVVLPGRDVRLNLIYSF